MKIKDYQVYNERMAKTLVDKVWWLDQIDDSITTIVDFGCADASIFELVETIFPGRFRYIGIDNDPTMLVKAKSKGFSNAFFFNDFDSFMLGMSFEALPVEGESTILLFNSVMHEVFTYLEEDERKSLGRSVILLRPKYIAVRDMHRLELNIYPEQDEEVFLHDIRAISQSDYALPWLDFLRSNSNIHNDIANTLTEFFLKHTYKENWAREKDEIYLWNWSLLFRQFFGKNYKVQFENDFNIPYVENLILEHFYIRWPYKTHKKLLLKAF